LLRPGKQRYTLVGPGLTEPIDMRERGPISTIGLNSRFNPGSTVVAKY
jgi:hypothetical protein